MAEKYLNDTGLKYYHDRVAKVKFADKTEFTNLQTRVEGIANEGGEPNVITGIKLNGVTQTITDKVVDIVVADPDMSAYSTTESMNTAINAAIAGLASSSDIADFITADQADTKIAEALADITGIDFQVVTELPSSGEKGVIYLIANGSEYDEYIYINDTFELLGTTKVDLSDYVKKTDITTISTAEIDELFTE